MREKMLQIQMNDKSQNQKGQGKAERRNQDFVSEYCS